jgi:HD-GYP domain-containing protein (c-di-GMP phosphodiesterase class II)
VRLTTVTRAVGLPLARDLPATAGRVPLLARGAVITDRYAHALSAHGIHAVWVDDELSAGIEPAELLPEADRAEAAAHVRKALDGARSAFATKQPLGHGALADLARVVDDIARCIADTPEAALVLEDLAAADEYTHRHSVNVTALGLLIAGVHFRRNGWIDYRGVRRYDHLDERMSLLGMGLLLHDIGKMAVPAEVLNKPGPLDDEEWALMRGHPEAGVALLQTRSMSALVRTVIRDHHERFDGSGYPRGIADGEIHQFASIAAVADVYDAITSQRPYKAASPPHVGVRVIADGDGTSFDPDIVGTFRRVVFPHPPGTELKLADGRVGVVARVETTEPDVPVVRVAGADGEVEEVAVDTRTGLAT